MKNKKKKDEALESLARFLGIEIKKVNSKEMEETQIVSVGRNQGGRNGELKVISNLISSYQQKRNIKKELEEQEKNFRFAMQCMRDRHDTELRIAQGFDVCEPPDD